MRSSARPAARVWSALALLAGSWAAVSGQFDSPGGARLLLHEAGLPAVDRGLRDQDPPRDPGGPRPRPLRADGADPASGEVPALYLPGSVIVKFREGSDRSAALRSIGSTIDRVSSVSPRRPSDANFELMDVTTGADPEEVAAALRSRPDVEYAQPRYLNHAMLRPNDPLYANQWSFPAIDMERAWDIQPGATSSIVVAVIDTGVAHRTATFRYTSRFAFRLVAGGPVYPALGVVDVPFVAAPELGDASRFVAARDFIWDDSAPVDLDGHGTHVSGTIGQLTNNAVGVAGMACNVRLMPIKAISGEWDFIFGAPNSGTDDVVARAIRYAADNGAKVINLSIGRTGGGPAPVIEDALRYAVERGAFVAIASGNGRETGNLPNRLGEIAPAVPGLMVVGAVGRTLDAAFYSTTGPSVEISAPGGDQRRSGSTGGILQQTLDQDLLHTYARGPAQFGPPRADAVVYSYLQGTSMATPHVSGFAALLVQQGLTSPAAIEAAMKQYATDKGAAGRDDVYGAGLINPRATLRGLGLAK
jgi:serine protease